MPREFELVEVDNIRLGEIRDVVAALAQHLGLKLWKYQWQDGGTDYEFRPEK